MATREATRIYHAYKTIAHRFACGERKIWENIEKSQNIMKLIKGHLLPHSTRCSPHLFFNILSFAYPTIPDAVWFIYITDPPNKLSKMGKAKEKGTFKYGLITSLTLSQRLLGGWRTLLLLPTSALLHNISSSWYFHVCISYLTLFSFAKIWLLIAHTCVKVKINPPDLRTVYWKTLIFQSNQPMTK